VVLVDWLPYATWIPSWLPGYHFCRKHLHNNRIPGLFKKQIAFRHLRNDPSGLAPDDPPVSSRSGFTQPGSRQSDPSGRIHGRQSLSSRQKALPNSIVSIPKKSRMSSSRRQVAEPDHIPVLAPLSGPALFSVWHRSVQPDLRNDGLKNRPGPGQKGKNQSFQNPFP
jgi:hypothetical protein